jgi:glycosyltransferase involved in cell wall biosynthesis
MNVEDLLKEVKKNAAILSKNKKYSDALSLVVPCYNEEFRLQKLDFVMALHLQPDLKIVFVNDGSKDRTLDVLGEIKDGFPNQISILDLPRNMGKAEAVRHGMLFAIKGGANTVGYWDADLATPLEIVPIFNRVLQRQPEVEVVLGSRRRLLGRKIDRTIKRRVVSRICSLLATLSLGVNVGDSQCGAKLFRVNPKLERALSKEFEAGWLFDIELLSRLIICTKMTQHSLYELPLPMWSEVEGSKVSSSAIIKCGLTMIKMIIKLRISPLLGINTSHDENAEELSKKLIAGE